MMAANSWISIEDDEKIIAKKIVDLSVFNDGVHIPIEYREAFLNILSEPLNKGKGASIELLIDDKEFKAELRNIDVKERKDDVIQLRYTSNSELKNYLKQRFKTSYNYITAHKVEGSKKPIPLPNEYEEIIEFRDVGKKDTIKLNLITKNISGIKEEFYSYIGERDVLENNKYQASYKLLLLLYLLKLSNDKGQADYQTVCEEITSFYLDTYKKNSKAEVENMEIQKKIQDLSVNTMKSIINENPYKVISSKGYIYKENEIIQFSRELWDELSSEDKRELMSILENKLKLYYKDRVGIMLDEEIVHIEAQKEEIDDEVEKTLNEIEIEDISDIMKHIHQFISSKGYDFDEDIIKNYYLSLKAKPFVLLAGISGTGKSKLVKLFAEALGATSENGRFALIPVRTDWSDPSDLLGYKDIEGKFQPGPLTQIIKSAMEDKSHKPYFVCLDEMNLARVEYYFSDILSVMESREREKDSNQIVTDKIFRREAFASDIEAYEKYGKLYIPDNFYIIGTVNMDETTFPFSKKVLDRANTIEFNYVSLGVDFDEIGEQELQTLKFDNDKMVSKYVKLKECAAEKERVYEIIDFLEEINHCLVETGSHFGYRVRDEIVFYTLYALQDNLFQMEEALDNAVKQKILPRIQGSNLRTKEVLLQLLGILAKFTEGKYDVYDNEVAVKLKKDLFDGKTGIPYEKSIRKIINMIRRFDFDGFTTFWE